METGREAVWKRRFFQRFFGFFQLTSLLDDFRLARFDFFFQAFDFGLLGHIECLPM